MVGTICHRLWEGFLCDTTISILTIFLLFFWFRLVSKSILYLQFIFGIPKESEFDCQSVNNGYITMGIHYPLSSNPLVHQYTSKEVVTLVCLRLREKPWCDVIINLCDITHMVALNKSNQIKNQIRAGRRILTSSDHLFRLDMSICNRELRNKNLLIIWCLRQYSKYSGGLFFLWKLRKLAVCNYANRTTPSLITLCSDIMLLSF